jgi:hypothetical protein
MYKDFFDKQRNENTLNNLVDNFIQGDVKGLKYEKELFPLKIMENIGKSIENGVFLSKNLFIRKEIWFQPNAKINGLHLKYEAYKTISEKIENLNLLYKHNNVINFNNVEKFCADLGEIQNSLAKEFSQIKPALYSEKPLVTFE